ncbi:MAG: Ig-like domain-containing protein, partial [Thermomicrobiales bacterium]
LSGTPTATGTFSFTVTATDHNGFPGMQSYTITVTAAPLVSIAITCAGSATPSIKVGQMVQCLAMGTYQDGSTQPLPAGQVRWGGDNAQIASVEPTTGKVTGESPGTIHLTATDGNVTQTITVTVSGPTPIGIVVGPAPASRPGGASVPSSSAPTPAPSVPSRGGGGGSGSAPAPLPPGR